MSVSVGAADGPAPLGAAGLRCCSPPATEPWAPRVADRRAVSAPPTRMPTPQLHQGISDIRQHRLKVMQGCPAAFLQPRLLISFQPFVVGLPADFIAPAQFRQTLFPRSHSSMKLCFSSKAFLSFQGKRFLLCPLFRKLRLSRKVSKTFSVQSVNYVAGPDLNCDATGRSHHGKITHIDSPEDV